MHGIAIASTRRGRHLLALLRQYNESDPKSRELAVLSRRISQEVSKHADLFEPEVRDIIATAASEMGSDVGSARSNEEAKRTNFNLLVALSKVAIGSVASNFLAAAFMGTAPGAAVSSDIAELINAVWGFLISNSDLIVTYATLCGPEFLWMLPLLNWVRAKRSYV